jgi:hypothetical protein
MLPFEVRAITEMVEELSDEIDRWSFLVFILPD